MVRLIAALAIFLGCCLEPAYAEPCGPGDTFNVLQRDGEWGAFDRSTGARVGWCSGTLLSSVDLDMVWSEMDAIEKDNRDLTKRVKVLDAQLLAASQTADEYFNNWQAAQRDAAEAARDDGVHWFWPAIAGTGFGAAVVAILVSVL